MVVFVDGRPEKSRYRTYKVRAPGRAGGGGDFASRNDDFASMYEVLSRRFRRAREESAQGQTDGSWALPDLIVIDGGKGQLGMALAAARDVGIDVRPGAGLSIVGLAKERDSLEGGGIEPEPVAATPPEAPRRPSPRRPSPRRRSNRPPPRRTCAQARPQGQAHEGETVKMPDRVFLAHAKDAIPIRPNSAEMFVLQHLRDEAHRFAVTFHRSQRRRLTLRSALAEIPGIGEARQRLLLRHFGSVKKIREASLEDLAAVPGMTRASAAAVFEHWKRQPAPPGDPRTTRRCPFTSREKTGPRPTPPRRTPWTAPSRRSRPTPTSKKRPTPPRPTRSMT